MKKFALFILVVVIAALSVMAATAAPRDRYYDQMGNKHWCNSDSYGCWVTGENGEKEYIMFWSEAAAVMFMGSASGVPIGTNPGNSELGLMAPMPVKSSESGGGGGGASQCTPEQLAKKDSCDVNTQEWQDFPVCDCVLKKTGSCTLTEDICNNLPENNGKTCIVENQDVETCTCKCN